ncbi:alpha/beta fold hydrolase [Catenulispora rubra]|uniref:alpha/beta fold hydrolase n=1 Tax=Catenulispora rubra TaxID=280293 RepID=UPI0018923813|nr:alpha/beta hydrolase [Catenulispora rubra]
MSHAPLLILVHSPLVGPATWQPVADLLRGRYEVHVPSLHGIAASPGPYARRFAEAVARDAHHDEIVLVGHSGAGAYLPAVADALSGRVKAAAFIDAQLPRPGLSDFDASPPDFREALTAMAHDGMLPPWNQWFPPELMTELIPHTEQRKAFLDELHPIALAYFEEPAPHTVTWPEATRCAYLQLSEGYQEQADRAEALGWPTTRLDADHLAVVTRPEPVAAFLSEFVETLAKR